MPQYYGTFAIMALPPARKLHFDCVQHKLQGLTRPSTSLSGHAPLDKGAGGRVYNDDIAWLHVWRDGHSGASLHCAGFVGRGGAVALRMRLCICDLQLQSLGQLACIHRKTPLRSTLHSPDMAQDCTSSMIELSFANITLHRGPQAAITDTLMNTAHGHTERQNSPQKLSDGEPDCEQLPAHLRLLCHQVQRGA